MLLLVLDGTKQCGTIEYQMQGLVRRDEKTPKNLESKRLEEEASEPRRRLIEGMTQALLEKPFAAVTIADVVRHAHVSKRTFYEHFEDKNACFLACYAAMSDLALLAIEASASSVLPWREQVRKATKMYLSLLEAQPVLTRALLLEILSAGPDALALRREVMTRFVDKLRSFVEEGRKHEKGIVALSESMAFAVIGGVHELTLLAVEQGRAHRLTELADTATDLLVAVLTAPRA